MIEIPENLLFLINEAINVVSKTDDIRVISHHDADGICAAGILLHTFLRLNKRFHITIVRGLDPDFKTKLSNEKNRLIIFCDMGSAQIDMLKDLESEIIIFDHHVPSEDSKSKSKRIVHINSHLLGISGSYEGSTATLTFLFSIKEDEKNWDLLPYCVAGYIGDKQHLNGLQGLNKLVTEMAVKKDLVSVKRGLVLTGDTVFDCIYDSVEPFFKGLSGNKEKVLELLIHLHIDKDSKLSELDSAKKSILTSLLVLNLVASGVRSEFINGIVGDMYWCSPIEMYAKELANYINSCGKLGYGGIGLEFIMDSNSVMVTVKELRKKYLQKVRENLIKIEKQGIIKNKSNIQYFYSDDAEISGAQAALGLMYLLDPEKPVIALSKLDGKTKISGRGTHYLVAKGLDLAFAMKISAKHVNGSGGGHNIAAGATIPSDMEDIFLDEVDKIVGEQLKKYKQQVLRA